MMPEVIAVAAEIVVAKAPSLSHLSKATVIY
jgi:hypothetical protein